MTEPNDQVIDWEPRPSPPSDNWRTSGWILIVLGVIGLVAGFLMETSVSTGDYGADDVINFALQFQQGFILDGGMFAIGLGVFCLGVSAVLTAIERMGRLK